jgi:hypothetical protein
MEASGVCSVRCPGLLARNWSHLTLIGYTFNSL